MHMTPPTTLTMCPSCERVSASSSSAMAAATPPPSTASGGGGRIPTVVGQPTPCAEISLQSRLAH